MPDAIDQTIAALHDAGASDEEITALLKEKFGSGQSEVPATTPGVVSRFASGVWRNVNPVAMVKGAADAVMHPADTYNALVDKSAENFTEAKRLMDSGEYGHALHHGIAAVLPPYNVVTHAGDEIRQGNVAGGVGEAVGAGAITHATPANARTALKTAADTTESGLAKATTLAKNYPRTTAALGSAALGGHYGGTPGAIIGGIAGAATGELLHSPGALVRRMVKAALETPETPAVITAPASVTAPPVAPPALPFKLNKIDVARITALDKELGAANTARALRHDPRFADMTAAERVATIRSISSEPPNTLPANAARAIDEKFNAIEPAKRAAYIETWKTVNPAVYSYLQSKLSGTP